MNDIRIGLWAEHGALDAIAREDAIDEALEAIALPPGTEPGMEADAALFLHGHCGPFALALNRVTGYPIRIVLDDECEDGPSGYIVHAYCGIPCGDGEACADVRGATTDFDAFLDPFSDFATVPANIHDASGPSRLRDWLESLMGRDALDRWIGAAEQYIRVRPDWYGTGPGQSPPGQLKDAESA